MKLGIVEYIDCAHFLPEHPKCGSLHGHTYKVEMVIEGESRGGMILDFSDFKKAVRTVLAKYDHRSWNEFLTYPSVENICELLHREMKTALPFAFTLRVWEGHGKWAEL